MNQPNLSLRRRRFIGLSLAVSMAVLTGPALAQDSASKPVLHVMTSGGFAAALQRLSPLYAAATGVRIELTYGASMGESPTALPARLRRGEAADVVVLVGDALDDLVKANLVLADGRTDLARSRIAMAVRSGAPIPDIRTLASFRQTLQNAKSVAWSDSASGVFLQNTLFPRLALADAMRTKGRMVPATPVGQVVARGQAEIGFQQLSELMPVAGITIVGPIPEEAQKITVFSAAVGTHSTQVKAARALVTFLASKAVAPEIRQTGLEPMGAVQ